MKIGFIGLGTMGRHMASNLIKAGHGLVVHDVRREAAAPHREAGARWAETPRAVAEATDVVFTSLPGPPEVEAGAPGGQGPPALAEVFTLGAKAGVDPLALWKAVRQGAAGRRRTFDGLVDQFLPGRFEPAAFTLRLAHKDVTLATALGREHKVPMRLANLALEELTEALNRGWGERDSRVAMLLQEERAGVEIRVPDTAIRQALELDQHTAGHVRRQRPRRR